MDRCSSSSCQGQCSCGFLQDHGSSFSIYFAAPCDGTNVEDPLASSSVDCTLSLGTPSTRQTETNRRPTYMSNLCWDIFNAKQPPSSSSSHKSERASNSSSSILNLGSSDSRLVRRCANCDTTSTPLWRNGPRGPKSLCNACGIRYKKEERRATTNSSAAMEAHHLIGHHWNYAGQPQNAVPAAVNGEFRLIEEDDHGDSTSPYLSWRLNVPPQDFPVHMT